MSGKKPVAMRVSFYPKVGSAQRHERKPEHEQDRHDHEE